MKHYVGLDVSLKEVSICVVDGDGVVPAEGKVATDTSVIVSWIEDLKPRLGNADLRMVLNRILASGSCRSSEERVGSARRGHLNSPCRNGFQAPID